MGEELRVSSIEPQDLEALLRRGAIDLIDVSTPVEYDEVRVRGARNVPIGSLALEALMATRSGSERPLYVMCRGGVRSLKVCRRYPARNLVDVAGGTRRWLERELPVVREGKLLSLERQASLTAGALLLCCAVIGWVVAPVALVVSAGIGMLLALAGATDHRLLEVAISKLPWNNAATRREPVTPAASTAR